MTEEEFIREAKEDWEDEDQPINTLFQALEARYQNGSYDNIDGNVDAPTGHFYIIERWVVVTDDQGYSRIHGHDTNEEAETTFNKMEAEYSEWDND